MHGLPFVYVHGATPPRTARGWTEVGMSVYKHVLVALGLITACGHVQASEPVPTAAAATAMFYGRSEEHTSELQSLMRISYAVFCLKKKKQTVYSTTVHYNHNN